MSEFGDMYDHDQRLREPKEGEYLLPSVARGMIACYRTGMQLVDFYRTRGLLAKDQPALPPLPKAKP